jgi:hypothetical protein
MFFAEAMHEGRTLAVSIGTGHAAGFLAGMNPAQGRHGAEKSEETAPTSRSSQNFKNLLKQRQ